MKQFKVTIKSNKGEIVLGNLGDGKQDDHARNVAGTVTGVDVKFDTINDDVKKKSHGMIARVTVRGKIIQENHKELKEVMQWAVDQNVDTEYRTVLVEMIVGQGGDSYGYELPQMFVVDYAEMYQSESETDDTGEPGVSPDTFELKLSQRENFLGEIHPF